MNSVSHTVVICSCPLKQLNTRDLLTGKMLKDAAVTKDTLVVLNTNGVLAAGPILKGGSEITLPMRSDDKDEAHLKTPQALAMLKNGKQLVTAFTPNGSTYAVVAFKEEILKVNVEENSHNFSGHRRCNLHGEILGIAGSCWAQDNW
jgi:hypothetical protein